MIDDINFKHLIENNSKALAKMETGIRYMFNNKKLNELKEAYKLISNSPESLKNITDELDPFIRERGDELYNNKEIARDPISKFFLILEFIPELIKLKKELDSLVEFAFDNHILFQDTKNKAFSFFMNKEHYPKQLANFCDYEMKAGIKGANENQIEEKLNNIINIFKCLNNKLIFQIEYAKKLSDRLISNKTQSIIAEKSFISKLKAEAGVTYVSRMTSMIQDLDSSKVEMEVYKSKSTHKGIPNGIQLNVQVLQHGAWEIDKNRFDKLDVPIFLNSIKEDFSNFYYGRHKNHKLSWAYGLGNIDIKYLQLNKEYQSTSTLLQLLILLTLEKYNKKSIQELSEILGYNVNILTNEANGLIYNPLFNLKRSNIGGLILTDSTDNSDLKPESVISLNMNFIANSLKINTIPTNIKVFKYLYRNPIHKKM